MRSPFDILEAYERRSLAHAVQLPERQFAQDLWRGVGYRVGQRRLVSDFREVVEIVPMPPVTPVPCAQPWLLGVGNLRGNLFPVVDLKYFWKARAPCSRKASAC
jgi:twitching motility protein PilI